MTDEARTCLERIERESTGAHELTFRVVQFADGSRLMAIPATITDKIVIDLAETIPAD